MRLETGAGLLRFRRSRDQICHAIHGGLQNVADEVGHLRVTRRFGIQVHDKSGMKLGGVLATMRGKEDFQRLKQGGSSARPFEQCANLGFVMLRQCRDDCFFAAKVAVNQPDTDAGFGADVVHAGLVKAALGKAENRRTQDLGGAVLTIGAIVRGHVNEHNE